MFPTVPAAAFSRRSFLRGAAGTAATLLAGPAALPGAGPTPGELVKGKDDRLLVQSAKPTVMETPLPLLGDRVTPLPLLFVRNNQKLPGSETLAPLPLAGWKVECVGLVDKIHTLDAAEIAQMEQVEVELVLQCSGNGRTGFNKAAKVKGTQWGKGAMGNVRFGGVPLAAVLERYKIKPTGEARYLTAEGRDDPEPGKPDFEHSLPLDDALRRAILAFRLNGEPLPAVHGGPLRLVMPGYYATTHLKWLSRLRFEPSETTNDYQIPHYRTPLLPIKPGEDYVFTLANSRPSWKMKVASYLLAPSEGAEVPAGQRVEVRGIAFNDGDVRIETVEVSFDEGQTWRRAAVELPTSRYAWASWKLLHTFEAGKATVWCRATDALGRSQPLDGTIAWNPNGYEWNGVDRVEVVAK